MLRLVVPVENLEALEKARPGLIFRTDLPYHTAKGELKYRKGWVKPEDSRALDRAKKHGDPSTVIGKYQYEEDMFDDGEGEAWEKPKAAEEAKPEPEAAPQPAPEPIAEAKPEPEAPAEEAKAPLYIEDLTEKAIIVRGDTRTYKAAIKMAGGKWNSKHGGWIFPKKWESNVRARLAHLLVPPKSAILTSADVPQKSVGHLGFFTVNGRRKELLEYETGGIYTADLDDVIDVRTGFRIGRWEGPAWQKDTILTRLGLKAKEAPQEAPEAKENIKEAPADAPSKQDSLPAGNSEQPSRVADRIAKPEVPDGEVAKTGDVQSDLEKPIAKMKFRDYGSWSAAGKHLSPAKRAALNQEIAELLNLPADEIEPKELDLIRQYSGFGGVKAEDERGVLYDFYTSPPVARMVWKLANKIVPLASGARVLEPSCGTGVFFDVAPQGVDLTGVEFDPRTAAAAGLLQPQARIYHASYEQFNLHEHEKFDAVVGNAPFGDRSVETQFLDESGEKSLDRYFISRSLDNLKSGGSMAMIVGPGVMDNSTSRDWRAKMLRKGQFIGAVRLPNESFKHTQTGVNPDVVMFRAYPEDVRSRLATMSDEEMKQAGFFDEAFVEGGYFEENPAHRLGRVERGRFDSEVTVGKLDPADMDRAFEQFQPRDMKGREDFDRVRSMTEGRKVAEEAPGNLTAEEAAAVAAKTLRVGMTKTVNGKVYKLNANHRWELVDTAGPTARKLDRIKEIGEVVRAIRAAMRNDEPVDDLQRQARSLIESYEKEFSSKHTDDADIQRFLKANPSVAGVYEATTISADSDLLTKQNVYNKEIEIVDGHRPAIRALLDMQRDMMNGTVEEIRARFPNEADALIQAMWSDTDIFLDADGTFRLREDFVAGNAWEKIDALEAAIKAHHGDEYAAHRGRWQAGIEALRDAAGWVPIEDADVSPQAVWIPEEIVNRWADTYRKAPDGYRYGRNESGKWGVIAENKTSEWDFKRRTYIDREAGEWREHNDEFVYFLNSQKQRGKYTDTDTYNKNALASFKTWLATDEQARAEIEEIYNRQFNTELGAPNKTYAVNIEGWNPNIELKPWQWQSIHHLYRQGKGISALGTGYGKAQPLDAKILTPDGWKRMGDIRVGDRVIGADGNPTKVVGVFPQGEKEIFEVTFSDGGKTQACGEHLWETQSHSERAHGKPAVIRSTEDLRRSLRKNYSIPIVAPVSFEKRSYAIPPYTLGVLLGDGCFSQDKSLTVSNPEAEIAHYLAEEIPPSLRLSIHNYENKCPLIGICRKVSTGRSPYLEYLRSCGLIGKWSHEKFIPDEYLFGAIEDRIAILRGLMDTDGFADNRGICVQFNTSSPTLASNVATLVRSLGGLVSESTKIPTFSYLGEKKTGMLTYILTLKMPPEINPFRLPRKADRVIAKTKYVPRRYIRSIESVGNKLAQCIMVENPRHLYVTDDFILTHNTYAGIGLFALLRQEGKVHRAFFQVPNNKVKDWVEDFGKAMPGLKVGAIDPDGEGMAKQENRFAAYQKLASGDYDVIIMPETSASEIQLTEEADAAIVADYADQLASKKSEEGAAMGAPSEKEKKKTAREQQKAKDRAESSLTGGKKNATITFEEFGCDAVFADECFPYGAKVKTDHGDVPIGDLFEKPIDFKVLSCDTITGKLEYKRVLRKIPRTLNHAVLKVNYEGGYLVCTDSHKIWTEEHGYRRADEIEAGTTLRVLRESNERRSSQTAVLLKALCELGKNRFWKACREAVRSLREAFQLQVLRRGQQHQAPVLLRALCGGIPEQSPSCEGVGRETDVELVAEVQSRRETVGSATGIHFRQNEGQQSYETPGSGHEGACIKQGTNLFSPWWKRTDYQSSSHAIRGNEIADGVSHQNKAGRRKVSILTSLLQGRPRYTGNENCDRGGWVHSQNAEMEVFGRKKNRNLECVRVDSVEVLERGDFVRYGFRDSADSTVYDIEVEDNHNFFADGVLVSNCHRMKNLFTSSLSRETGMNDGRRSDRALSFFKKCEAVRRANDGKNVFGLTATPLTNSPLEYYNMMQHIAPEMLKAKGIASIDQFIQTFADIKDGEKFDPFSGKLKPGKVLEGFKNLKSLQDMFFRFTDLQNDPTKIGLKKPTPNNKANVLPKSDDQVAVVKQIAEDFKKFKMMTMEEREGLKLSNFTFYGRMRTASLDLELYDPEAFKGWKNPKVEQMADNALDIYNARGGGQVIFCDRVLSGDGSFNMHEKIKKALVARGFKEDEIVIVNGLTKGGGKASDSALERLVSDAIDGYNGKYDKQGNLVVTPKYKFIIGTTQTIGEGVNLQKNSAALHHVDIPYRPSDFIQRNGRIDRQGNKQSTVELHSYAAAGTIDNYSMALVSGKEGWINQLLKTKSNVFTNPNGDGYDMEEILMSLSEEWGDKAGADEKRAAIEAKKAAVIKQENIKKSGEYLKQLSLMRGALAAYQGDKGSRDYQNRLRKIDNIEAALRNNPEFHAAEILGADGVPFIYHEGTGKVVRKGDLYLDKGRVYRVSGFNHKKRTFEISSAITGEVAGEGNAYADSKEYSYNRDRSFFVDNPTPEVVDRYIALTVPEQFHQRPIEFKRDNYADFVDMHSGNYSSKVHPIVRSEDGNVRLASYYNKDYPLVNPYSDEGRAEIASALESGKLTASSYRQMEEEYGDLGGGERARAAEMKEFEDKPGAKPAMEALSKIKPVYGWYSLRELAEALPAGEDYASEYRLRAIFNSHPDAETTLISFNGSTDYAVRFKQGMQKSSHYGKMVSEGGRVYVLLERGR